MFQKKVVEKIKTHILCSITLFQKSCRLRHNDEKYGRTRDHTGDNIVRSMCFACCITKATDTHSEYVILLFHGNSGHVNATQCYVTCLLPVLFFVPYRSSKRAPVFALHTSILYSTSCQTFCNRSCSFLQLLFVFNPSSYWGWQASAGCDAAPGRIHI
jgi:hypothetical protein